MLQSKLPAIEEAWTLPIPAELTQRQTARRATRRNVNSEVQRIVRQKRESKIGTTDKVPTITADKVDDAKETGKGAQSSRKSAAVAVAANAIIMYRIRLSYHQRCNHRHFSTMGVKSRREIGHAQFEAEFTLVDAAPGLRARASPVWPVCRRLHAQK